MTSERHELELLIGASSADDRLVLRSPNVGVFRTRLEEGALLGPGSIAGTLEQLGATWLLRVPSTAQGLVATIHGELHARPVQYDQALIELKPLDGSAAALTAAPDSLDDDVPAVHAGQSGRFYQRSGPTASPFVQPGDPIEAGQVIGLIEVMKTFSQVRHEGEPAVAGAYLVADGAEVERGDPVLELRETRVSQED